MHDFLIVFAVLCCQSRFAGLSTSDVNKDFSHKDHDKDKDFKNFTSKDKDFTVKDKDKDQDLSLKYRARTVNYIARTRIR